MDNSASTSDIRQVGMLLDAIMQRWAGALGGGPAPGSPLANDLLEAPKFATKRLSDPFSQSWAYSQTLGLVATNHEAVLRESLLNYANSQTQTKPVTVVTTLAREILETLSVQAWLIDPSIDARERFERWMSLEFQSECAAWRIVHPGIGCIKNPIVQQLVADADALGIDRDRSTSPRWIGVRPRKSTDLAEELLRKYPAYANTGGVGSSGALFYRLFSGEIHATVGSVLTLLLPTGTSDSGSQIHVYNLSHGALWRAASIVLMSTFAARCIYAEWLGRPMDPETRRIHLHHIDLAIRKLTQNPQDPLT
jgi:hypothetical protein